ncbi:MAG: 1-acyl-sn-glycerol-3-phosphate acyltransferase [Anaerolineales bacterium]|nr:MAG: 1-acyl-sn-glycerol-3-phosphate acyltransferase [Anaerolineales bacterium]
MTFTYRIVIAAFKGLTSLLCRIDDAQLAQVPDQGPLLVVTNHVNILEIPIVYTRLQPRPVTGFVSARRWDSRWLRWLLDVCGAIPLRRGEADVAALRKGMEMLKAGHIVVIAPEGTRSGHGRLQKAHPGVVLLALHSGAPLLPVVYHGSERYQDNLRQLRRTDFHIVVGKPFYLDAGGVKVTRQVRRQMIDEVMYQMSALLPPAYRGAYSDLNAATEMYLTFQPSLR